MKNKTVIITGATSGIGKETAKGLANLGANLILIARDKTKIENTINEIKAQNRDIIIEYVLCDLASMKQIHEASNEIKKRYSKIDVLINNAGLILTERKITEDGFEYTFAVNHLAYFLLTGLLLDVLKAASKARIVNVSSIVQTMGNIYFDDIMLEKKYNDLKAYAQSKLANILFTYELARKLKNSNITVNCVHPGGVNTNFDRNLHGFWGILWRLMKPFLLTPQQGAQTSIYVASSPEIEQITGTFFAKKRPIKSSKITYNTEVAQRLWKLSEELTGIKY